MRRMLVMVVIIGSLLIPPPARAQDCGLDTCTPTPTDSPTATSTPSDTPTPTATFTPTPDVQFRLTLPPPDATLAGTPGTPAPGQAAVFEYRADAGQLVTNVLLFALLVSKWIEMLLAIFRRPK